MRTLVGLIFLLYAPLPASATQTPTVLVVGDSLASGHRIRFETSWVKLLQDRLRSRGYPHAVVTASVPGDTTARALARLPAVLEAHPPSVVLIELGPNDAWRRRPVAEIREDLRTMIRLARAAGSTVALFEMKLPPERSEPAYAAAFQEMYTQLAREEGAHLVPFFLQTILAEPNAFLEDGIHPSEQSQDELLEAVWPSVAALVKLRPVSSAGGGG